MSVSLDQARTIADACLVKGRELSLKPLSVVVIDPRTSIVMVYLKMDAANRKQRIALGKAKAAIQLGLGTRALMRRAEEQAYFIQSMNGLADGEFVPVPGGVLLRDQSGALLGAVSISGDTSDNDSCCACWHCCCRSCWRNRQITDQLSRAEAYELCVTGRSINVTQNIFLHFAHRILRQCIDNNKLARLFKLGKRGRQ